MAKTVIEIITALGAIGTFVSVIITFAKMLKIVKTVNFKAEKLYGKEAEERYDELLEKIPDIYRDSFGPDVYTGGNKSTPQFEVERFYFDKQTMPSEWKNHTKTIHYYYKDEAAGKIMVRGWRL
jgi:hypothetical protein